MVKRSRELEEKIEAQTKANLDEKSSIPSKPEDYKLDVDPKVGVDPKQVEEFKAVAHSLKLNNDQANAFFKLAGERAIKAIQDFKAGIDTAHETTTATLKKEWGADYEKEWSVLKRGMSAYASKELLAEADRTGMGNSVHFIKLLHRLGQLTREDSALVKPGSVGSSKSAAATDLYPTMQKK